MNTLVIEKAGKPVTTSLKVAEIFEKQHKNVLRDIVNIRSTLKAIGKPALNFEPSSRIVQGKRQPMFEMDRDAFTLLAFGYNGMKAMGFKLDFIKAFNAMELELMKAQTKLVDSSNLPTILRIAADALENDQNVKPLLLPAAEKPKTEMTLTKIPRNMKTAGVNYTLGSLGFKPINTTNFLKSEGYLKLAPGLTKNKTRKIPTEKGEAYFRADNNGGLYMKQDGIQFVLDLRDAGEIPQDCLKEIA